MRKKINLDDERDSFVISINKNGIIRNFPISIRNFISKFILDNIRTSPHIPNKDLINIIIKSLKEIKNINEFNIKICSDKYTSPIKNFLNDLILIIREINNYDGIINITHLTNRLLKNTELTTYTTYGGITSITRQIIDFFDSFPNLDFNRQRMDTNTDEFKKRRKIKLEAKHKEYQRFAIDKGGSLRTGLIEFLILVGDESPDKVKLEWTCDKYPEHDSFESTFNNIRSGSWCPFHFRENQKKWQIERIGYKYKNLRSVAYDRGGQLLTPEDKFDIIIETIKPSRALLKWACKKYPKHSPWPARPHDIIIKNEWCPECASGKYEKICRWYFEQVFNSRFPKTTLSSLNLNIDNYNCLNDYDTAILDNLISYGHFDGYNTIIINDCQYILAFEYNGYQHYVYPNRYHKDKAQFDKQLIRDSLKLQISKYNNIILIVFPYNISERMNEPQEIQNYIIEKFEKKIGIKLPQMRQFEFVDDDD